MALVGLAVAGLAEGAEHEEAEDAFFGLAFDLGDEALVVAGRNGDFFGDDDVFVSRFFVGRAALRFALLVAELVDRHGADAEGNAELGGHLLKFKDAFGVWLFVDAVDGSAAGGGEVGGDGFIGREHELFDDAVGDIAGAACNADHFAELVEFDEGFGEVEIDGTALEAAAHKDFGEFLHPFKAFEEGFVTGFQFRIAGFCIGREEFVDAGIGHALDGADDAAAETLGDGLAGVVELDEGRHDEAVLLGHEGADVGGKLLGEHGHGAVREVDAGAAEAGFGVDGRAGEDVVADVGDVDLQGVVAVGEEIDEDGVVEVAGGFAIDGDDGEVAEILAAFCV